MRWSTLPGQCEVCHAWGRAGLCADCQARFAAPQARCRRCALPLPAGAAGDCGECLRRPPPYARAVTVADYGFPWDGLIAAFKFHQRLQLAPLFARSLQSALAEAGAEPPDLVMPIPLNPARLQARGYNQAWEIACRVARLNRWPADALLLQRWRDTPHQTGLTRAERERNLAGAFIVPPEAAVRLRGRHLALLDDVVTSGATAAAATEVLLQAGAARVQLWMVARTPPPD